MHYSQAEFESVIKEIREQMAKGENCRGRQWVDVTTYWNGVLDQWSCNAPEYTKEYEFAKDADFHNYHTYNDIL